MRGDREREKVEEVEEGKQSLDWFESGKLSDRGITHQIPGENRGPSYLLALQPAANHLYLIVRHKLYEDQLGIWPQSLLRRWIGVPASRESTGRETCHMFWRTWTLSRIYQGLNTHTHPSCVERGLRINMDFIHATPPLPQTRTCVHRRILHRPKCLIGLSLSSFYVRPVMRSQLDP